MDRVPDSDGNESVVMPKRHNLLHFRTGTPRNEANRIKSCPPLLHFVRGSRRDDHGGPQATASPQIPTGIARS